MATTQPQTCDLLIVGDLNIDYLGGVPRFPGRDEEVELKTLQGYLGGSGANAAVVATRLGLRVDFYSAVGDDVSGADLARMIAAEGIATEHTLRIPGQASGMVFGAFGPDGDRRLYSFRGANLALGPQDLPNSALAGSRRLHLNGPEYNLAFDLLVRSRKLDVPNSLDPGSILIHEHPAEMPLLLANTDVLFVNHVEFAELGGGQSDAENAANLLGQGVGWVVMKSGEHGCTVFRAGHAPLRAPAFDIQAVDSTGAGDAFNAAFLYALLRGDTLPQVLRFANAVGALVALAVGATSGAPKGVDAVERFMRETNVKDEG